MTTLYIVVTGNTIQHAYGPFTFDEAIEFGKTTNEMNPRMMPLNPNLGD